MFENLQHPIAPHHVFRRRAGNAVGMAMILVMVALVIGIMGYHFLGALHWVDALLEAAMILGGMGPVAPMQNDAVKIFAAFYALFSGFVLLSSFGVVIAPWLHRLLHRFHGAPQGK